MHSSRLLLERLKEHSPQSQPTIHNRLGGMLMLERERER